MKDSMIAVRMENDYKEKLKEDAMRLGISMSEMNRRIVENYYNNNREVKISINLYEKICVLMTEIQRVKYDNPEIDIQNVERKAELLWKL